MGDSALTDSMFWLIDQEALHFKDEDQKILIFW